MKKLIRLAAVVTLGAIPVMVPAQNTWSAPKAVNPDFLTDSVDDTKVRVAKGKPGDVMAVWLRPLSFDGNPEGIDVLAAHGSAYGQNWTEPVLVNSDAATNGDVLEADIVYAGSGVWVCQWIAADTAGGASSVNISRSTDFGQTWSHALRIDLGGAAADQGEEEISIASDGAGKIISTWLTPETQNNIIIVKSTDAGITWSAPVRHIESGFTYEDSMVAFGGNGKWAHAYYEDRPNIVFGRFGDIFVRSSTDNGQTWSEPTSAHSWAGTADDQLNDIEMVDNTIVLAFNQFDSNTHVGNIRFLRTSHDLGATFLPRFIVGSVEFESEASLAADGEGNWVAMHDRSPEDDLVALYSSDNGITWNPTTGLAEPAAERSPALVSPAPDYFAALYQSNRTQGGQPGTDNDIYQVSLGNAPKAAARDWQLFQ